MFDGRAYVADNRRKDGKVWAGTTALAVLAAVELDAPVAAAWGAFLASSVDDEGQVRGELRKKTRAFPPQAQNPYGQGQVTLALAALVAASGFSTQMCLPAARARMPSSKWVETGVAMTTALTSGLTINASASGVVDTSE